MNKKYCYKLELQQETFENLKNILPQNKLSDAATLIMIMLNDAVSICDWIQDEELHWCYNLNFRVFQQKFGSKPMSNFDIEKFTLNFSRVAVLVPQEYGFTFEVDWTGLPKEIENTFNKLGMKVEVVSLIDKW